MNMMGLNSGPPSSLVFPAGFKNDASLYVGNLNPLVSDEMLFHEFAPFGNIVSLRVMKNVYTGESRGFGFVTFSDVGSAQRAQKDMNARQIYKRELRVHFKKNTKNLNREANFIIKNIHKNMTSKQLNEECAKYGEIVSCFIRRDDEDDNNASLGYGYVQFERTEDGNRFFEEFNGKEINGQQVVAERFVDPATRAKTDPTNMYIKSFPAAWDKVKVEEFIKTEFGKLGEITCSGVYLNEKLKAFYAFVAMGESKACAEAIKELHDKEIEETKLYVQPAQSKIQRKNQAKRERGFVSQSTNLYVRSLRPEITQEEFRAAFEKYGKITSVCLRDWKPHPRGNEIPSAPESPPPLAMKFGFINFTTEEEAQNVMLGYKKDADIRAIVTAEGETPFIFFAQSKTTRNNYLKMQKRMREQLRLNMMQYNMKNQGKRGHKGPMMGPMVQGGFPTQFGPGMGMMPPMMPGGQMGMPGMGLPMGAPMMAQLQPNLMQQMPNPRQGGAPDNSQGPPDYKKIAEDLRRNQKEFQAKSTDEQKNLLGNIMYNRVRSMQKNEQLIPKITGMLIDTEVLEFDEILEIIEDDTALKERIEEAIEVINENIENGEQKND